MLKYQGKFRVGDIIRAYDFFPRTCTGASFIVGEVIDAENRERGFLAYKVMQYRHVVGGEYDPDEVGTEAWIPMEVSGMDFDGRIELVCGEDMIGRGFINPDGYKFDGDQVKS